ncbi:unnamed protein product [Brachionus calyciflorus]|uniref:SWIM-type domain-containing protein n=1 Tax=Brachionus calyciflorus TaxID=104777 RepID=A0A813P972_9BILA|nr:unnamed protein product [Brachionus calyciflorus]
MELNQELNQNSQKERKRRRIFWSLEIIFNSYDEAITSIKNKWTKTKFEHITNKEYFKCALNEKCKAKMHLYCLDNSLQVNFIRDQTEHDHNYQNLNKRLRKEIKNRIIELYKFGVTAPLNMLYTLRKDGSVNLPSQKQIFNFIARNKKNLKGETQIKYCELASWYYDTYLVADNGIEDEFEEMYELIECEKTNYDCYFEKFTFDSYINLKKIIKRVKLHKDFWVQSKCICKDYLKLYLCKHITSIAVKLKLTEINYSFRPVANFYKIHKMACWGLAGAYGYGLGAYGLGYQYGLYNHAATYPYAGLAGY